MGAPTQILQLQSIYNFNQAFTRNGEYLKFRLQIFCLLFLSFLSLIVAIVNKPLEVGRFADYSVHFLFSFSFFLD